MDPDGLAVREMNEMATRHTRARTRTLLAFAISLFPRLLVCTFPLAFLALFFFLPLGAILRLSFGQNSGLAALLGDPYYLRVVGFSAWLGALSVVLTLAVALPGSFLFARFQFPGKTVLRALATVPFVLPTVVVAAAFGELLGPAGMVNRVVQQAFGLAEPPFRLERSIWLVLLTHVFYNYSIVLRIVGGFWESLDTRLEQAAAVLGANRWRVLREITLPLLAPVIGAAALLVFIFSFASFGVVLILGGPQMATVEVEIYRQTAQLLRLDIASALALIQILVTLIMTLGYTRLQERASVTLAARARETNQRLARLATERTFLAANAAVLLLLIGAPLVALALRSVTTSSGMLTLDFYRRLGQNATRSLFFVPPTIAVRNSLLFAAATVVLSLGVGVPAAYLLMSQNSLNQNVRRTSKLRQRLRSSVPRFVFYVLNSAFTLPLGTSAVTLGLGYVVTFGTWGWLVSPLLVPIAHSLLAFPFVVRSLLPAMRALDPRMREAARTLGAGPFRVLCTIDLPLLAPALLVGAAYAFTVSLGDFGAVLLLNQTEYPTVPLVIYRFLGRPGSANYGQAMALCTILMLLSMGSFMLLEWIGPRQREF